MRQLASGPLCRMLVAETVHSCRTQPYRGACSAARHLEIAWPHSVLYLAPSITLKHISSNQLASYVNDVEHAFPFPPTHLLALPLVFPRTSGEPGPGFNRIGVIGV